MRTPLDNLRDDVKFSYELGGFEFDFLTTWGLFSPKSIDEGTELLIKYFKDIKSDAECLDLGCGYGPLGLTLAKLAPLGTTHMVDKDFVAVEYAAKNADLNNLKNTKTYLSNGFDHIPKDQKFDVITSNIPAKIGSELLTLFLLDAKARMNPGGQLYIVTISGLKDYMKRNIKEVFGNYDKLKQRTTYTAVKAICEV